MACGTHKIDGGAATSPSSHAMSHLRSAKLHVNKAGRRHVFTHARGLYEGCSLCVHYVAKIKCLGSGAMMIFDPRPNEHERFKVPDSLLEK
jgi:hypothetical protein